MGVRLALAVAHSFPCPSSCKKWLSLYALAGDRQAGGMSLNSALWTDKARRRDCDRCASLLDAGWWIICFLPAHSVLHAFVPHSPRKPYF